MCVIKIENMDDEDSSDLTKFNLRFGSFNTESINSINAVMRNHSKQHCFFYATGNDLTSQED